MTRRRRTRPAVSSAIALATIGLFAPTIADARPAVATTTPATREAATSPAAVITTPAVPAVEPVATPAPVEVAPVAATTPATAPTPPAVPTDAAPSVGPISTMPEHVAATTQADEGPDDRRPRGERGNQRSDRGQPPFYTRRGVIGIQGGWRAVDDPKPEEWAEIQTFMEQNSPFRLSVYKRLESEGRNAATLQEARKRIAYRYLSLEGLEDRDEALHDFAFRQFKLEDRVLAGIDKILRGEAAPETDAEVDRSIREWFENHMAEREARLKRLREFVDREEAALANDREKSPDLIRRQRELFENEVRRMTNPGGGNQENNENAGTRPSN